MSKAIFNIGDRVVLAKPLEQKKYYATPSRKDGMYTVIYEKDLAINRAGIIIVRNVTIIADGKIYYEVGFNKQKLYLWEWMFKPYRKNIITELI